MRTHIGHYEIVSELGRGGMGVVYKAYEPALTRYVAIKELSPALAHDQTLVERFLREARSMASLNDPHIIQIYFIGQENNQPFFVMEFVDGESLSTIIKREGRLFVGDALKILHQSAKGLSIAHDRGVIHRDIKPGNLMLTQRGQIKIADFGIALANHDFNSKLTGTGEFVGTPGYLSPEVCLGKMVDQRSDIFALGIVLFEMLTGRTPFSDESPLKLMLDVVQSEIPDVRSMNSDVDQDVADILKKMLEKEPNDRYQSTAELTAALEKHPLVTQSGTLQMKMLPPVGPAATMIGIPTPKTPASARAPTPPPSISLPASAQAPIPPPAAASQQSVPAAVIAQQQQTTRPGVTQIRNQRPQSTSGGKIMLLLGVGFAGILIMGGAWAVWRMFATASTAMITADANNAATTELVDADSNIATNTPDPTVPSITPPPTPADPTGTSVTAPDDQVSNPSISEPINNNGTASINVPPPVRDTPSGNSNAQNYGSNFNNNAGVDDDIDQPQTGKGSGNSIAIVTNGDPALMIPAQQMLENSFQDLGYNLVGNPKNARYVVRVKSDRIGSQELSFYGQTAIVTSAYISMKMSGPGGKSVNLMNEKIDYTPLNAEDKVRQAFEESVGKLNAAGE
jgi:eukaryotic-like serine/threonine-protein kinase